MIPTPQEQVAIIRNLTQQYPLRVGENQAYIISNSWLSMWKQFTGYDSSSHSNLPHPSEITNFKIDPIDNNDIVINENELDPTKREEIDFTILSPEVWNQFLHWFGGGPQISVPVYLNSNKQPTAIIHRFYIFCKYQNEDNVPFSVFNLMQLKELMNMARERFKIPNDIQIRFLEIDRKRTLDLNNTIYGNELHPNIKLIIDYRRLTSKTNEKWASESGFSELITTSKQETSDEEEYSSQNVYDEGDSEYTTKTPGVCGLRNIGNSCYFNSALQCLFHCVEFIRYFLQPTTTNDWHKNININNPIGAKGELVTSFANLANDIWSGKYISIKPLKLKESIDNFTNQFKGTQQQDAHELVTFLLDGIHEDLNNNQNLNANYNSAIFYYKNRILSSHLSMLSNSGISPDEIASANEIWENHKSKNNSIIVDMFQGLLRSQIVCPYCHETTVVFDPYMTLSLPLARQHAQTTTVIFVPFDFKKQYKKLSITYTKSEQICELIQEKVGYRAQFIFAHRQRIGSETSFSWGFQNGGPNIDLFALEVPYKTNIDDEGHLQRQSRGFEASEMQGFGQRNFAYQSSPQYGFSGFQPVHQMQQQQQPTPPPLLRAIPPMQQHQSRPRQPTPAPPFVRLETQSSWNQMQPVSPFAQPPQMNQIHHTMQHQMNPMQQIHHLPPPPPQIHHQMQQPPPPPPPPIHHFQQPVMQHSQMGHVQMQQGQHPQIGQIQNVPQICPQFSHMQQHQPPPPPPPLHPHHPQFDQVPLMQAPSYGQIQQIHQQPQFQPPPPPPPSQMPHILPVSRIPIGQNPNPNQAPFPPPPPPPNQNMNQYGQQQRQAGYPQYPPIGNHLYGGCPDFAIDTKPQKPNISMNKAGNVGLSAGNTDDTESPSYIACVLRVKVRIIGPITSEPKIIVKDASAPFLVPVEDFKITREELNSRLENYFDFCWHSSSEKVDENKSEVESEVDVEEIKEFLKDAVYDVEETELDFTQYRGNGELNPGRVMVQYPSEYYIINGENRYFKENPVNKRVSHIFYSVYVNEDYMKESEGFDYKLLFNHIQFVNIINNHIYTSEAISLQKCFKYFSENEVLDSRNQWFCKQCQKNVNANKKMDVWSAPKVLIIQLKRFVSYDDTIKKLDTNISYPEILDMSDYLVGPDKTRKNTYKLFAISEHFGGLMGGHYTAHALVTPTAIIHGQEKCKSNNYESGKWYYFNDSSVTKSSSHDAHSHNAYMLFYEKID